MQNLQTIIESLHLKPHPEGGYYAETYRSAHSIAVNALPDSFDGDRVLSTAIYYLLEATDFSAFHRIKSDELWHFYAGIGLHIYILSPGKSTMLKLGDNLADGYAYQQWVPAGAWFAAKPAAAKGFCLTGCTVAPGFDFRDFEMANRDELINQFPANLDWINSLTRDFPETSLGRD